MSNPKWSFIGLIHSCLASEKLDQDFGFIVGAVNTSSAIGNPKPKQHGVLRAFAKFAQIVIPARLSKGYKDTQFFTSSGAPIATPRVLQSAEVERLKGAA